jgi:hypothetical protein
MMFFSCWQWYDSTINLNTPLTSKDICRRLVNNQLRSRFRGPRLACHLHGRTSHYPHEGLLCERVLVHLLHMLLQAFALSALLQHRGISAHASTTGPWRWRLHSHLERDVTFGHSIPMSASSTVGAYDSALFQHCMSRTQTYRIGHEY